MKRFFYLLLIVFSLQFIASKYSVYAQGSGVSINSTGNSAHPSAILDVSSTSAPYMGMLIPRMSTANRNLIVSPATGLLVFNTDCGVTEYYTGSCWISMSTNLKEPKPITCSGTTDFCANETRTFSIPSVTGATEYNWSIPAGAIITSGQGTTSITVTFGNNSGQVCVHAENVCETSSHACIDIHINPVPPTPGNITGLTTVIPNSTATYFIASVAGAGVYNWSVPAGVTITSGVGTTTITVNFSCSAVSGNISVNAQSNCGNSSSNILPVTVLQVVANAGSGLTTPGTIGGSPTASGGTPPYTYAWVPSTALSSTTVPNPTTTVCTSTAYTVIVTDSKGCTASSSAIASMVNPITANAGPSIASPGTLGGSPTASGGTSPYTYSWVPSTSLSSTTVENPTTTVCSTTAYTVTVTDANGCTATSSTTASFTQSSIASPTEGTHVSSSIEIVWNWNSVNGATGYKYNTIPDYNAATDIGNTTTYTQTGLTCNTAYTLYVWSYDACLNSAPAAFNYSTASSCFFTATGGTVTTDGNYKIHTFTSNGTFIVTSGGNAEVLVVAGGGGGGTNSSNRSGGGGAGGLIHNSAYAVTPQSYTVTVGNGGAPNTNGQNSVFESLTAIGGGYGGAGPIQGGNGGSGGGAVEGGGSTYGTGVSGQGNDGGPGVGCCGAGGGGAGVAGSDKGGDGLAFSISGTSTYYAGGGGGSTDGTAKPGGLGGGGAGGNYSSGPGGQNGAPNTGGGGGAGIAGNAAAAGSGGSGVVIIRYLFQ